jgi:hypothetical protein
MLRPWQTYAVQEGLRLKLSCYALASNFDEMDGIQPVGYCIAVGKNSNNDRRVGIWLASWEIDIFSQQEDYNYTSHAR